MKRMMNLNSNLKNMKMLSGSCLEMGVSCLFFLRKVGQENNFDFLVLLWVSSFTFFFLYVLGIGFKIKKLRELMECGREDFKGLKGRRTERNGRVSISLLILTSIIFLY